jgi:hypothetical protein
MNEPRCRSAKLGIDGEKRTFVPWITPLNEGLGLGTFMQPGAAMNHPRDIADRPTANLAAITGAMVADSPILVAVSELRGAGDRGRNLEQAQPGLERLMRAGYVKRSLIEGTTARYLITDFGRRNLDAAMER